MACSLSKIEVALVPDAISGYLVDALFPPTVSLAENQLPPRLTSSS